MTRPNDTVATTVATGTCCSCGLCAAACRCGAISFATDGGSMVPVIDESACVHCGRCLAICPGANLASPPEAEPSPEELVGNVLESYSGWSTDEATLARAVSGGVVTQLVAELLANGRYDSAFLVTNATEGMDGTQPTTQRVSPEDDLTRTQKSRYLQVSHEPTLRYLLSNPKEHVIIVGVPCALSGIVSAIDAFRLSRDNYLLIGLFCDRTMTSNVLRYFERFAPGGRLSGVDFRTKEVSGWPGDLRIYGNAGAFTDLPARKRMEVKEYFQPECCLYCLDKLNRCADITVGDDYVHGTQINDGKGACSILVRTEAGMTALAATDDIALIPSDARDIAHSQHIENRLVNWHNARVLEGSHDVSQRDVRTRNSALKSIGIGKAYPEHPELLERELRRTSSPASKMRRRIKRVVGKALGKLRPKR